jgi:hypothetical protein
VEAAEPESLEPTEAVTAGVDTTANNTTTISSAQDSGPAAGGTVPVPYIFAPF